MRKNKLFFFLAPRRKSVTEVCFETKTHPLWWSRRRRGNETWPFRNRQETSLVLGKSMHQYAEELLYLSLELHQTSKATYLLIGAEVQEDERKGVKRRMEEAWEGETEPGSSSPTPTTHLVSVSRKWGVCAGAMRKPPVAWQAYLYHLSLW